MLTFIMNKISTFRRAQVLAGLVEGVGINSIARLVGVSNHTVLKLLAGVGDACAVYQDNTFRNLKSTRIECNEIWSFCLPKQKNVRPEHEGVFGFGDVYTWVAIDEDSKLVPAWYVGRRDAQSAMEFINDLASRLANRVELTTDGHKSYLDAVEGAFGSEIDYPLLSKIYGGSAEEVSYSPAEYLGTEKKWTSGSPVKEIVPTPHAERQNLTTRMSMGRFTRLTKAHSKKIENHIHAISLHHMHYNFCRIHKSLKCSPAMAAGVSDRLWDIEDIVKLLN
jgi:IS1 family transposase